MTLRGHQSYQISNIRNSASFASLNYCFTLFARGSGPLSVCLFWQMKSVTLYSRYTARDVPIQLCLSLGFFSSLFFFQIRECLTIFFSCSSNFFFFSLINRLRTRVNISRFQPGCLCMSADNSTDCNYENAPSPVPEGSTRTPEEMTSKRK